MRRIMNKGIPKAPWMNEGATPTPPQDFRAWRDNNHEKIKTVVQSNIIMSAVKRYLQNYVKGTEGAKLLVKFPLFDWNLDAERNIVDKFVEGSMVLYLFLPDFIQQQDWPVIHIPDKYSMYWGDHNPSSDERLLPALKLDASMNLSRVDHDSLSALRDICFPQLQTNNFKARLTMLVTYVAFTLFFLDILFDFEPHEILHRILLDTALSLIIGGKIFVETIAWLIYFLEQLYAITEKEKDMVWHVLAHTVDPTLKLTQTVRKEHLRMLLPIDTNVREPAVHDEHYTRMKNYFQQSKFIGGKQWLEVLLSLLVVLPGCDTLLANKRGEFIQRVEIFLQRSPEGVKALYNRHWLDGNPFTRLREKFAPPTSQKMADAIRSSLVAVPTDSEREINFFVVKIAWINIFLSIEQELMMKEEEKPRENIPTWSSRLLANFYTSARRRKPPQKERLLVNAAASSPV